ncbi:MAG: hypothetical protein U9R57_08605 [Thermodesulfobacteriota bacterium]|nr:hypothetical protein [Thermodesulfobacteriota bacterium]
MDFSKKMHRTFPFLLLFVLTVFPGNAWAVQSHGPPEGLYVHQMAHIFYAAALSYLAWDIQRSEFRSRGWRFLQVFCVLMIIWNVVALTGHALAGSVHSSYFTVHSNYLSIHLQGPFNTVKLLYYFTTLDHLVSVPAFICLFIAMRSIYRASLEKEEI